MIDPHKDSGNSGTPGDQQFNRAVPGTGPDGPGIPWELKKHRIMKRTPEENSEDSGISPGRL